jgi:hypothetical protein
MGTLCTLSLDERQIKLLLESLLSDFLWQRRNMKIAIKPVMLIIFGALLAGCAGMRSDLVLDTAGPTPAPTAQSTSGRGTLIVYSACKVNADFNSRDPNRREYSDYRILDRDRKLLEFIHNVTDDIIEGPVSVKLPVGKYFVVARSNGYGIVTIPVIIASRQNTILHLDGFDAWPDESEFNQTNAVCLPDGEIVGWKVTSKL